MADVDTVCTEQDLLDYDPAVRSRIMLAPDEWQQSAYNARQYALERVLHRFAQRTPPIEFTDLQAPTDLKLIVIYGALEHLYELAMTSPDGLHAAKRELYADRFNAEIEAFAPVLEDGEMAESVLVVEVERR